MPEYLAPGVFVEEVSFRSKTIEGVSTTTTGFIGPVRYGPVTEPPDVITSLSEFERSYGDGRRLAFNADGALESHNFMWHAARCLL
jgi:phage tail sheath protein FI